MGCQSPSEGRLRRSLRPRLVHSQSGVLVQDHSTPLFLLWEKALTLLLIGRGPPTLPRGLRPGVSLLIGMLISSEARLSQHQTPGCRGPAKSMLTLTLTPHEPWPAE